MKGGDIEYIGKSLAVNNDEDYSTMGEIVEDKSRGSTSKCAYLSKDLVDEYITKMEIQGCTIIYHLSRILFDT